ncbi:prominin-like protein isoform X2 [Anthonomus grandis grandis]|uniref:prominin-like protein isoform X2 n=1 Tax=Anthonomus grandis grandis TaxID=2921223 RepID=UPI002166182B|nr:prominin-like protein isoform X2 [Anthonomus grandis grandis]
MKHRERKKRFSVNAISLFVTCVFLFLAVEISDGKGSFTTRIKKITENLDMAVLGLDITVNYRDFNNTAQYYSNSSFNAAGMVGLYNLTKAFINVCAPEDILMPGIISIDKNDIKFNNPEPRDVISYYSQLVALVILLLLCVVLFPICGVFFCCCRCCGNCGARAKPSDKKKDTCKKVFYATLLIMCGTGLLFCIVCAFGSNQQIYDGLGEFPSSMRVGLKDTNTFMDTTNAEITHLLHDNYQDFYQKFIQVMDNSSTIAVEQLIGFANATNISEIQTFSQNLQNIKVMLFSLKNNTNQIRVYASQLNDAVRKVKWDLTTTLTQCSFRFCDEFSQEITKLQTSIDFNKVPDVTDTINSFDQLDIESIQKDVEEGKKSLDQLTESINKSVSDGLDTAREKINEAGETIDYNLKTVTDQISAVKDSININFSPIIDNTNYYTTEYGKYIYYAGLTVCCILLLVTVCIVLGLICGICGKRPDGYSDNCCNKGAGSRFLICAVGIMFLFGCIISTVTLVTLVTGVITEKAVCVSLRDPDPDKYTVVKLLDDTMKNQSQLKITFSGLINDCFQNKSVYNTFQLKNVFDLAKIKEGLNIEEQLNKLNFTVEIPKNFTLVSNDTFDKLRVFSPDIQVDKFRDELENQTFTNYNLEALTNSLENIIKQLQQKNDPGLSDLISDLLLSRLHLTTYSSKLIVPMKAVSQDLIKTATNLSEQLKMGFSNFSEAIDSLQEEIVKAQDYLNTTGPDSLKNISAEFIGATKQMIEGYIDRISDHIENKIGQCGPISLVFNSTVNSTCDKVLLPLNGFWFSLFWTIILYIITIIVSIILANLYQRHKPYDQFVETEYLYDAYADRGDNIPLHSRDKRGKKKGKKSKRYEERPGRDVARDYAGRSHPPDGRYADMAPKAYNAPGQMDQNSNNGNRTRF